MKKGIALSLIPASSRWLLTVLFAGTALLKGDDERRLAVEATATVLSPTTLRLDWKNDPNEGAGHYANYFVARRTLGDTGWVNEVAVPDGTWTYSDSSISSGSAYEYRVRKFYDGTGVPAGAYEGYGYVLSGAAIPFVHQRGRVLLFVESGVAPTIDNLDLLVFDLVGDGWTVTKVTTFSADSSPDDLRARVIQEYDPSEPNPALRLRAVFLFGHLPVPWAGPVNPDDHENRPLPADAFYGDVDGDWGVPSDGVYPRARLPSPIELQVGRVDFANLPDFGSDDTSVQSTLLRRYIDKAHAFRHRLVVPDHGALVGDGIGWNDGDNPAAAAYRNFAPLIGTGPDDLLVASTGSTVNSERWLGQVSTTSYLWVWGSGGGGLAPNLPVSLDWLGDYGEQDYNTVWCSDVEQRGAGGTFYLLFGSYHCNWAGQNAFLRVLLGLDTWGLASAWGARPFLNFHGMGLGETIGEGMRRSENNALSDEYFTTTPEDLQGIYMGLMGDPTLRLQPVEPVSNLSAVASGSTVTLAWNAPSDMSGVVGFHVYRATAPTGPFDCLTSGTPSLSTSFSDTPGNGTFFYMVRACKLQTSPSGTYYNGSQSVFTSVTVSGVTFGGAWTGADIAITGGSHNEGPPFTVTGAGSDVWDTADECRFVYQQYTGDFTIEAEVDDLTNTDAWAKAGVMIRESLDSDARNAFVLLTPGGVTDFQFRSATGSVTADSGAMWLQLGAKLRLVRSGDTLTGYWSTDGGANWQQAGAVTLPNLASSLCAGLAVTSHASGVNATGTFTAVAIHGSLMLGH